MNIHSAFAPRRLLLHHFVGAVVFLLALSSVARAQPQAQPAAAVDRVTIKSTVLGEDRVILVRTPAGYGTNTNRYPVLYMTDGDRHIGHTGSTVEFLAGNGRMSELIVVGITNTDRTRDLSPTHVATDAGGSGQRFPTSGGGDKFLSFIETELIPEIEKRYRIHPYRVLAGHSLGGLFAIHAMLSRPALFNSWVAVSPALHWDNQVLVKRADEFFKARKELKGTLFVTLGREPGPIDDAFYQLKQLLTKNQPKGLEWEVLVMDDEDHGSVVLRSHYFGLRKIYSGWQISRDPDTGAVIAGDLKGVQEHYKQLAGKFGYSVPIPENLINQVGYQLLFGGRADDAIAAFKSNVERYPNSANVYDSLAEAYERGGRLELAMPLYEKAKNLGQQNSDPNLAVYKTNFDRVSGKLKQAEAAKKNEEK